MALVSEASCSEGLNSARQRQERSVLPSDPRLGPGIFFPLESLMLWLVLITLEVFFAKDPSWISGGVEEGDMAKAAVWKGYKLQPSHQCSVVLSSMLQAFLTLVCVCGCISITTCVTSEGCVSFDTGGNHKAQKLKSTLCVN